MLHRILRRSSAAIRLPLIGVFCTAALAYSAEPLRINVSRDTAVSSYATETEFSRGASPKLKFKGVQEFSLLDIDCAALHGKRVTKAELHLHGEGPEVLGRMTVSTITEDWVEGTGNSTKVPGASSFAWARTGEKRWGDGGHDMTSVINGVGGSLWSFADATARDADGWQVIAVAPDVVQARIDGRSFGFAVMDDVGSEYSRDGNAFTYRPFLNRYVSSKDDKRSTCPYFLLWLDDEATARPAAAEPQRSNVTLATLPPLPAPGKTASGGKPTVECRDELGAPLASLEFFAAKGETICFTVAAKASIALGQVRTKTFTMPLVEGRADPLKPGDSDGPTCIELHIPKDAQPGRIEGKLTIGTESWPCALTIWNFTLPDHLSFIPQMNAYSVPNHERDYYRLAHEHRTTLNVLPYHWTGTLDAGPVIKADGTWDWTVWDEQYGALFDGSAFKDLPRAGVPIETFYLMLNENWPMDHERHFKGGYWIESAFDEAYWQQFREASSRIAQHIRERGWSEPMFEFYLNNKVSGKAAGWGKSTAAWILDEPSNTQDFWALRNYGIEFWKGVGQQAGTHLVYRADISRPQWQRDLLDGVTNVEVVSGSLRTYGARVHERAQRFGNLVYMYGSANPIGTPNATVAAWCVEAWALGADGVVPWQTIGTAKSWQKLDELSLFYPTPDGPLPSLRLKAFRAGQQLVEYLTQFTALSGASRESVAAAVLSEPGMIATTVKKNDDDAGKSAFGADAQQSIASLRLRLGTWLDAKAPPPRERWHDPRPKPHDAGNVKEISVVK